MNNGKFTPENYFKEAPVACPKKLELADTVELMNSPDYKDRFVAEYLQLKIRLDKLSKFINKVRSGTAGFKPSCPLALLIEQCGAMADYIKCLERGACIVGIRLGEFSNLERLMITRHEAVELLCELADSTALSEEVKNKLVEIANIIDDENIGYHFWGAKTLEKGKVFATYEKSSMTPQLLDELEALSEKYSYIPSAHERDEIYRNIDECSSEDEDWEDK